MERQAVSFSFANDPFHLRVQVVRKVGQLWWNTSMDEHLTRECVLERVEELFKVV